MRRAAHLLVVLPALVALRSGLAQDAPTPPKSPVVSAAARLSRAFDAKDEAAQDAIAADTTLDPIDVMASLWVRHIYLFDGKAKEDRLETMRAFARRVKSRPDAAGVEALVERHVAMGAAGAAADERHRLAWKAARLSKERDGRVEGLRRLLAEKDLPATLLIAVIRVDLAHTLANENRAAEAAAAHADNGRFGDALPWPRLAKDSWEVAARMYVSLSAWGPAAEALEHAAEWHRRVGDEPAEAAALRNLAVARRRVGRFDAALDAAIAAEALYARRGETRPGRGARQARAAVLMDLGRLGEAEALLRAIIAEAKQDGDAESAGTAGVDLGYLLHRTGRVAEGLTLIEKEIERLRLAGPSIALSTACRNAAVILRGTGALERALVLQKEAASVSEAVGDRAGAAAALLNLGAIAFSLGRLDEARERYHAVVRARLDGGDVREASLARLNLSALERMAGRNDVALALCVEAKTELEAHGLPLPPSLHLVMARTYSALGEDAKALASYEDAVRGAEASGGDIMPSAPIFFEAAAARHEAGRSREALDLVRRSLTLRRDSAQGFEPVEAESLDRRVSEASGLGVSIVASMAAAKKMPADEAVAEAFRFCDWGRALALADALTSRDDLRRQGLTDDQREEDLRSREAVERSRASLEQALAAPDGKDAEAARAALDRAVAERDAVVARLHRLGTAAAHVAWPEPIDAAAARRALRPSEALVLYQLYGGRVFAVVLRREGGGLVDLGSDEGLANDASSWLRLASVPGGPEEALAARLGARLVEPLLDRLEGAGTWIIVPDGVCAFLPFDALRVGPKGARVVERATVAMVPSANVLAMLRAAGAGRPRGQRVLALGDPAVGDGHDARATSLFAEDSARARLPASADEAKDVAATVPESARTLLLGGDASAARLKAALAAPGPAFRAVHLACHARVDPVHPRLSGLLLAGNDVLDLDDVHHLRVDADLVVLSGCETGGGQWLTSEGVIGLARGFFVAGASRVVASAWKVGDASTRSLMHRFYAGLSEGLAPGDALARAKREALARGGADAHPSRWAAFVLWGPPD